MPRVPDRRPPYAHALHALPLLAALLCAACGDSARTHRTMALSECRLPRVAQAVQCGTLSVPENRVRPDGRHIDIFVAVLPANTLDPAPDPLVLLAGGPGQAASSIAPFAQLLAPIRRTRDIVLVDQRGTGRSSALSCKAFTPDDRAEFELDPLPKARDCLAEIEARGVDPAQYTTTAFVEDLDAVRAALGYPRLNLWGGSYGTRVAQEYLRRHPDRVRSMVLDGVAPPAMRITLDVWRTRDQALDGIIAACRASPACSKALPDPAATLAELERKLHGAPATVEDPRTGAPLDVTLTFDHVIAALQPLTYAPELASLIPELLVRARDGDFAPLIAATLAFTSDLNEQMNAALHYSVTCAEDVPRIDEASRTQMLAGSRGRSLAARIVSVCGVWPHGAMPPDFATPVQSSVPTLLLSGGLDPVTPPAYAAEVAKTLPNSRNVVATGYGHIVSPHACAPRLIAAFVDKASVDALPAACVDFLKQTTRPPFFVDRLVARP
jgi:pimeloyl-ACP methyl ester carboxylesterase